MTAGHEMGSKETACAMEVDLGLIWREHAGAALRYATVLVGASVSAVWHWLVEAYHRIARPLGQIHGAPLQQARAWMNNGRGLVKDWMGGGENLRSKDIAILHQGPETFLSVMLIDGVFVELIFQLLIGPPSIFDLFID